MRIWIDAEPVSRAPRLFGFTTLERLLRAVSRVSGAVTEIVVSGMPDAPADPRYRNLGDSGPLAARLSAYLAAGADPVLALDGAAVIDHRLPPLLIRNTTPACFIGDGSAILRLTPETPPPAEAATLLQAAEAMLASGAIREVGAEELPDFVVNLRRNVPFTLEIMRSGAERDALEKRMFHLNYKGSTDFMTKWVYPPIVWQLVRLCIRWKITPNMVTLLGIFLAVIAVPLFASQHWIAGLAAAYAMTVLDSVDGKLARLTLTNSPIGNILDHGLDLVHPPFWYAGWAMGLVAGGASPVLYTALIWLIVFYCADRLSLKVAKKRFKRGLHAVTPLDGMVRTWIARRNVNLVIFTIGLALGIGPAAFLFITLWQGLTWAWHTGRTIWLYPRERHAALLT